MLVKGYLLAALHSLEFKKLFGVDLSPLDIEKAKQIIPSAEISYADAFDYLDQNVGKFDVIILMGMNIKFGIEMLLRCWSASTGGALSAKSCSQDPGMGI